MTEDIYVIAMYCLDEDGETLRRKRPMKVRERYGHADCTNVPCLVCNYREESRTVAWFPTFEEAEDVVLNGAPWDCLYSHAVIEKVPAGVHCLGSEVLGWYKLIREEGKHEGDCKVVKVERPATYDNIVNLTMG